MKLLPLLLLLSYLTLAQKKPFGSMRVAPMTGIF